LRPLSRKERVEVNEMNEPLQGDILPMEISVPEAARYLGVGKRVIYQLLEYGELRAVRKHGKILVDPVSLREFRASGKQP